MMRHAGRRWKALLLLLGGLLLGAGLGLMILLPQRSAAGPGPRRLPPTVGSPVPDFLLSGLDGTSQKLSDLRGKPVVVNFWATWCEPCKKEMPLLQATAQKYPGLVVLGVNYEEKVEVIRPVIEQNKVTYPILLDSVGIVSDLYFVRNFPMTFFIDSGGTLRAQHLGLLEEADLNRYLQTIGIHP